MARLYADENFVYEVVLRLRELGHDVLTALEAEQANRGIPDPHVLTFAHGQQRSVLTINRWHFIKLHRQSQDHDGILVCSEDQDASALAQRIHDAIVANEPLQGKLIRINRLA